MCARPMRRARASKSAQWWNSRKLHVEIFTVLICALARVANLRSSYRVARALCYKLANVAITMDEYSSRRSLLYHRRELEDELRVG